ncbi:hypothetical protein MAR_033730 [Mya arenaria]|uniref:Uncharacterized protein n=1 Tax=Mya arenaria TaxID=6604 RepID=A0ABY7G9T7_MYAAR|nr:hypothetical protein MAR_033730 [Mya arenaria]
MKNSNVLNHYKETYKTCAVGFIKSNDQSYCPATHDAYFKSFEAFIEKVKKLQKNKHRPKGAADLELFLDEDYKFPQAQLQKRVLHVTTNEDLDLKNSLITSKVNEQTLTEKLVETETLLKEKDSELQLKETAISSVKSKLVSTQLNLKRTKARETYSLQKIQKLEDRVTGECCQESKNRIKELEKELAEKDLLNNNNLENITIDILDEISQRYTPSFKECVYELLKLQTSFKIYCVEYESAQAQIAEVFAKGENTCLLTDETSKFGSKYMGQLWVLGLRDIETKSSEDTLKVFKEILSDIDYISNSDSVSREIVAHISATMSDRAATEMKFNSLLECYRKEILPLTYHNYDQFSNEERSSLENLNNFFCGLHALVNYAETSQKCMSEVEKEIYDDAPPITDSSFRQQNEPGTCRLVRTASKAFGEGSGGDQKSGCQGPFQTFVEDFLKEKNLNSVPLKSYRGSRFNILFSNACCCFFA